MPKFMNGNGKRKYKEKGKYRYYHTAIFTCSLAQSIASR
jgi:hypothetical protein